MAEKHPLMNELSFTATLFDTDRMVKKVRWYYWNIMGRGHYLVACVTGVPFEPSGEMRALDWACYLGSNEAGARKELDGWKDALSHGAKMPERIARAAFPQFADIPYRP